ncbi:hypothetical protein [Nostoc sp. WHI]|jgi:hypothetical protein|uniref:hypothetical protein n=1 Tax=Nostoc sp. WHI TaxID=2650611 RepID=UPI0018C4BB94|nr:hypothetical protein [Nostoc sp. WHI]MBG1270544.1 hypothetical protein [Nostoc sp. WHI]
MSNLSQFDPPAHQNDFKAGEEHQEKALRARWNDIIKLFTQRALNNTPWSLTNQPAVNQYYNPLDTSIPNGTGGAAIKWTAFPNRIELSYSNEDILTRSKYADEGTPDPNWTPLGARGWQDEYCEWSVTRNANNKITKVMFTCENREYWYTLWDIDPEVVLRLYQQLVSPQVKLEDLYLNNNNEPIIDPATGRPAYNDLNKWNSTTTNGAVHLISGPNTLSAQILLASQATILRKDDGGNPVTDPGRLLEYSRYGTRNRNSDPHIGVTVNNLVRGSGAPGSGVRITLENPVGLYIQEPRFDLYRLPRTAPSGARPSDYWKIIRGRKRQNGEDVDYILHAVFEVPEEHGFTVSDITIDGSNIQYGSQITRTFEVALVGVPLPQIDLLQELPRSEDLRPALPRPNWLRELNLFQVATRSGLNMRIELGTTVQNVLLRASNADAGATIEFKDGFGVRVTSVAPGGTNEDRYFVLSITVDADAPLGNRSLLLTNPDGSHGPAVYGLLEVVKPGTLAKVEEDLPASMKAADISLESVVSYEYLKKLALENPEKR